MVDTLTTAQRSERMSRIRGKDTRPEVLLRKALHRLGLRYRLHVVALSGKPDLVFPRYQTALFVHGCFWHRHQGCSIANTPKSNTKFWKEKFARNVARDAQTLLDLAARGWRVLIVWECEVNTERKVAIRASEVASLIRKTSNVKKHSTE